MFSKEDFEISLEKKLKMRIIMDEIDHCEDVEVLRESLKSTAEQLMCYQNLLSKAVEKNLIAVASQLDGKIGEILKDIHA